MHKDFDNLSSEDEEEVNAKPVKKKVKVQRTLSGFVHVKKFQKKRPAPVSKDKPPPKKKKAPPPKPSRPLKRLECNRSGINHNEKICKFLEELATFERVKGDVHRSSAYNKAVVAIRGVDKPIKTKKEALKLFGVGKKIADKIETFVSTGSHPALEKRRKDPELLALRELNKVKDTELNAKQRLGLKYVSDLEERIPREEVTKIFDFVQKEVQKIDVGLKAECTGSYRRGKPTSGDVDILITHDREDKKSFKRLVAKLKEKNFLVAELSFGPTKFLGICKHPGYPKHRRIDLLYFKKSSYFSALIWYTGSGTFNRVLNLHAAEVNMQLNEKGLYNLKSEKGAKEKIKGSLVSVSSEEEVFTTLGL